MSLPLYGLVEAAPSNRALEKGNWNVIEDLNVSNETVILTGNLNVGSGAKLTLNNVSVIFNLSVDGGFRIFIHDDGELVLNKTVIRSGTPGLRYGFVVLDGTISASHTNFYNFSSISFTRSTATLVTSIFLANGGTVLFSERSTVKITECAIFEKGSGTGIQAQNSTVILNSTTLTNTGGSRNIGINSSGETDLTLNGGGIYDFSTGIYDRGEWLRVYDVHISGATEEGIFQIASYSEIINNTLVDNLDGLHIIGSRTNITGNDIKAKRTGIVTNGGLMSVIGNTVWSCEIGISISYTSDNVLRGNIIRDNGIGLWLNSSIEQPIINNTFEGNNISLVAMESRTDIKDCWFLSKTLDVDLIHSDLTMVNSKISKDRLDMDSTLKVDWFVDVFVRTGTGAGVANASVEFVDKRGIHDIKTTDNDGWVKNVRLTAAFKDWITASEYIPYQVKAFKGPYSGIVEIDQDMAVTVNITINEMDLYLDEITLTGFMTDVGETLIINVTIGSEYYPVQNVKLEILDNGGFYASKTFDLMSGPISILFPFSSNSPGLHDVTIFLDRDAKFMDKNRTNNVEHLAINVTDGRGNGTGLPDLHPISISPNTGSAGINIRVEISVDIENSGTTDATDVMIELRIDGDVVGKHAIETLHPGAFAQVTFVWTGTAGKHTIWVGVDPDNTINESDETNNIAQTDVDLTDSTSDPGTLDAVAIVCGIVVLVVILVIALLIFILMRKNKQPQQGVYQYPYQYPPQYAQQPQGPGPYGMPPAKPANVSEKYTDILISETEVVSKDPPLSNKMCIQCGSWDIRSFKNGRRECIHCGKVQ